VGLGYYKEFYIVYIYYRGLLGLLACLSSADILITAPVPWWRLDGIYSTDAKVS